MKSVLDNVSLLPWQSTILVWASVAAIGLFVAILLGMIAITILQNTNERLYEKFHTALCLILGALIINLGILVVMALSFLVEVELGWKLALLTAASAILYAVSTIMLLFGLCADMSMRSFWIWMLLAMFSFAFLMNLFIMSAQVAKANQNLNPVNENSLIK